MVRHFTAGLPCALVAVVAVAGPPLAARQESRVGTSQTTAESVALVACVLRQDDFSRRIGPDAEPTIQILLTDIASGRPSHALTGTREADLARHVGRRVRIIGTVEQPRDAAAATVDVPREPNPHEPTTTVLGSDRVGDDRPRPGAVDDPAYLVAILPRVNAASFTVVEGACATPPGPTATTGAAVARRDEPPPPRVAVASPAPVPPLTAIGCLARQTADGPVLTAQGDLSRDEFVLTGASVSDPSPLPGAGAVPGSTPTGDGSGTIPASSTPRAAGSNAVTFAFALVVEDEDVAALAKQVGTRVEVVGSIEETASQRTDRSADAPRPAGTTGRVEIPPASAHPTAPMRRLAVASVTTVGGACR